MEDVMEVIGEVAEPVVDTLQEWGADAVDYVKDHAPQYIRYAVCVLLNVSSVGSCGCT